MTIAPTCAAPCVATYKMRAWSTRIELVVTEPGTMVDAVRVLRDEIDRMDLLANRFRPEAELTRLNRQSGSTVAVSDDLTELLGVALGAAKVTEGTVDPTVGTALCRLGYDRDIGALAGGLPGRLPGPCPVAGWEAVELDRRARTVRVPAGTLLDLGATAKAIAADRIAERVAVELGCGVLVSLGGDIRVAGPLDAPFPVGVADRCGTPAPDCVVSLHAGGFASSGTAARRWRLGRDEVHHIVDPRTGLPVTPFWRVVSVAAPTCLAANVAATAAMVQGSAAVRWLESWHLPARLVSVTGIPVRTTRWPKESIDAGAGRDPRR